MKQNFLQRFSNFNFRKKKPKQIEMKKRKERKKQGRPQFVINYHTPFQKPNNSTYLLPLLCSDREISDMILITKSNISSYN